MTRAVTFCALIFLWLFATNAHASPPELRVFAGAAVVELGDEVDVTLQAMSSTSMPTHPQIGNTPGFSVIRATSMPSQQMMIVNGVRSDRRGLNTTWTLRATKMGTFSIGPPTIEIDGVKSSAQRITMKVVSVGSAPRQNPNAFNPFDPFGGLLGPNFGGGNDLLPEPQDTRQRIPLDPKLALDRPRNGGAAFLHATVDKTNAIVGEQVTLTIFLYIDIEAHDDEPAEAHEATADDFIRKSLTKDDNTTERAGFAEAGGKYYDVRVVRKIALFPLKPGDLAIGSMHLQFRNGPESDSESFIIHVSEPPLAGRPAGWNTGDVGKFSLSADVTPRTAARGSAVSATVVLSGIGNLPNELPMPVQAGVRFLTPEIHDKQTVSGNKVGGEKTFSYVIELGKEGEIDLGAVAVPFFDPETRKYSVASAALGKILVTHNDAIAESTAPTALPDLPAKRSTFGGTRNVVSHITDRSWAWMSLLAPPLCFAFALGTTEIVRRTQRQRALKKTSPLALLDAKEKAHAEALRGSDAGAIDAATIRVIEAAVLARLGKNLRSETGAELVRQLTAAGASAALAERIQKVLAQCEAARFAPDAASTDDARKRAEEARTILRSLSLQRVES